MRGRFFFVIEQTLGHVAHTRNLERALRATDWIEGEIVRLPYEPAGHGRLPGLRNWSLRASLMARAALKRRLGEGPLDAAFIHTQVASLLSVGVMRSVPTVVSLDATPVNFDDVGDAYGHRRGRSLAEAAKASVNRRSFMAAAALVTWSGLAADSLVGDYGVPASRVHVIPPGVDLALFRPPERAGHPDGPVRVLFVGGDFVRKGGPDMLAALQGVPGVELDVVTGSEVGQVPPGVRCHVHRGLRPSDPALLELYRRADVFALPTRGDCLPQVLAEAAASGLPLIATDVGAIAEVVRHGDNGFLVPVGSPADLRLALHRLVDNAELRLAMGQASLDLARREHDALANNRRIFELMGEVAPGAGVRLLASHRR